MAKLILTDDEKSAGSYTDWDDASLGKLCKKVALLIDDKKGEHAVQATGAALLLIEAAVHADSRRSSWKVDGVTIHEPVGDFEILINRLPKKSRKCR